MLINKKAAMFGLDARIALAIFGALSVISGAALYSAIQTAKTKAFLTELNEFGKAFEQYYLDTGSVLPMLGTNPAASDYSYFIYNATKLISSTESGWKGPYINYNKFSAEFLEHPKGRELYFIEAEFNGLIGGANPWTSALCSAGEKCALWININYVKDLNLIKKLDKLVDSSDGDAVGAIRWYSSGVNHFLSYRYMAFKNRAG